MRTYTEHDLQIVDGRDWTKRHPESLFLAGVATPMALVAHVIHDIVYQGGEATVGRSGEWWWVRSNIEWMHHEKLPKQALFQRIVPAPYLGVNSMRSEVILSCYAKDIVLVTRRAFELIQGSDAGVPERKQLNWRKYQEGLLFRGIWQGRDNRQR